MSVLPSLLIGLAPARGSAACPPAREVGAQAPLPAAWRVAYDDLLAALGRADRPWSCSGATIRLTPRSDDGATLEVTEPQGRTAERFVPSPDDLVPIGQAVLSQT